MRNIASIQITVRKDSKSIAVTGEADLSRFLKNDYIYIVGKPFLSVTEIKGSTLTLATAPGFDYTGVANLVAGHVPLRDLHQKISQQSDSWASVLESFDKWLNSIGTVTFKTATGVKTINTVPKLVQDVSAQSDKIQQNLQLIGQVPSHAQNAANSAAAATASQTAAKTSENNSKASEVAAANSASTASAAKTSAKASESSSKASEIAAANSATAAANAKNAAKSSETKSKSSEVAVNNAASAAATSQVAAKTSETNAKASEAAAASSANAAASSKMEARTAQTNSKNSETAAAQSATTAEAAKTAAKQSEQSAKSSESSAASSASAAASSASAAEQAKSQAEAIAGGKFLPLTGGVVTGDTSIQRTGYAARFNLIGGGTGHYNAGLYLEATQGNNVRGLGVFSRDKASKTEWFSGRPYAASDQYIIARQTGVDSHNGTTADLSKALFSLKPERLYCNVPQQISSNTDAGIDIKKQASAANDWNYINYYNRANTRTVAVGSNTSNDFFVHNVLKDTTFLVYDRLHFANKNGAITFGIENAGTAHIRSDRPAIYVDKPLHVETSIHIYGVGTRLDRDELYFQNKQAIAANDSWLRINQAGAFSSGVYFGTSNVRTDNRLEVGNNGSTFNVSGAGINYKGQPVLYTNSKGVLNKLYTNNGSLIEGTSSDIATGLSIGQDTVNADAFITFHVGGDYALNFGLDGSSNKLSVGGWTMGNAVYALYHEGNKPNKADVGLSHVVNLPVSHSFTSNSTGHYASQKAVYDAHQDAINKSVSSYQHDGNETIVRRGKLTIVDVWTNVSVTKTLNDSTFLHGDTVHIIKHYAANQLTLNASQNMYIDNGTFATSHHVEDGAAGMIVCSRLNDHWRVKFLD